MVHEYGPVFSKKFAHMPLDAVAHDRVAHPLANRDSQPAPLNAAAFEESNKVLILYLFTVIQQVNELGPLEEPVSVAKTLPFCL
jgi:hypothetical protein